MALAVTRWQKSAWTFSVYGDARGWQGTVKNQYVLLCVKSGNFKLYNWEPMELSSKTEEEERAYENAVSKFQLVDGPKCVSVGSHDGEYNHAMVEARLGE